MSTTPQSTKLQKELLQMMILNMHSRIMIPKQQKLLSIVEKQKKVKKNLTEQQKAAHYARFWQLVDGYAKNSTQNVQEPSVPSATSMNAQPQTAKAVQSVIPQEDVEILLQLRTSEAVCTQELKKPKVVSFHDWKASLESEASKEAGNSTQFKHPHSTSSF
uniref:Uncharacterized protein n=1 Tax=Panagrolaimus sp. JU765 TaxID=591449 RepID=A0AC34PUB7_9BILA